MRKRRLGKALVAVFAGLVNQAWGEALVVTGNTAPMRGSIATYTAQTDPPGLPLAQVNWAYLRAGATQLYTDPNLDGDDKSLWSGRMVVGGTLTCTALVNGVQCSAQMVITTSARSWSTPLTCAEDNEPDWGDAPTLPAPLGENRDRDSNMMDIFVPQSNGTWDSSYTIMEVSIGPCQGLWYVVSSVLKSQRETVINRYIKPDGPTLGGWTFAGINDYYGCLTPSAAAFLQAVRNHEYRGTPAVAKSSTGHYGRLEKAVRDFDHDPKKRIETIIASSSTQLRYAVNDAIATDEQAVREYFRSETDQAQNGPNWGQGSGSLGIGLNARWLENSSTWSYCVNGPGNF